MFPVITQQILSIGKSQVTGPVSRDIRREHGARVGRGGASFCHSSKGNGLFGCPGLARQVGEGHFWQSEVDTVSGIQVSDAVLVVLINEAAAVFFARGKWTSKAGTTKIIKNCTRCTCRLACMPSDPCTGLKLLLAGQLIVEPAPKVQCVGHLDKHLQTYSLIYDWTNCCLMPQHILPPSPDTFCHHPELHVTSNSGTTCTSRTCDACSIISILGGSLFCVSLLQVPRHFLLR